MNDTVAYYRTAPSELLPAKKGKTDGTSDSDIDRCTLDVGQNGTLLITLSKSLGIQEKNKFPPQNRFSSNLFISWLAARQACDIHF